LPAKAKQENTDDPLHADDEWRGAIRDHVTFRAASDPLVQPMDAAADLVRHVRMGNKGRSPPVRVRPHRSYSGLVTVRVSWQGDRFHTIKVSATADGRLLASHNVAGGRDLSLMLHDWLTASDRYTDICWRTRDQWRNGDHGCGAPA
jgi:hypothetical protein